MWQSFARGPFFVIARPNKLESSEITNKRRRPLGSSLSTTGNQSKIPG
ncbi:MAG: hypothetical protein QNJ97_16510 [Myxococcota bacterium]|nr:hypothetical protein [Myxococcota bacterium]